MTFQQATQLIVHFATYMCKRKPKAQQIYIEAEPDAGKTTLYNLLTKTFKKRTFSVSAESKSFMAAAFDDRSKDVIWLEDEFNADLFWSFHQKHFNKIAEGALSAYVPIKSRAQKKIKYFGHVLLMGNYRLQEISKEETSDVRLRETQSRFHIYHMRKPPFLKREPDYRICSPHSLTLDLISLTVDIEGFHQVM